MCKEESFKNRFFLLTFQPYESIMVVDLLFSHDIMETKGSKNMKQDYRKTIYACFIGYIVQAIVNNFVPLFNTNLIKISYSLAKLIHKRVRETYRYDSFIFTVAISKQ